MLAFHIPTLNHCHHLGAAETHQFQPPMGRVNINTQFVVLWYSDYWHWLLFPLPVSASRLHWECRFSSVRWRHTRPNLDRSLLIPKPKHSYPQRQRVLVNERRVGCLFSWEAVTDVWCLITWKGTNSHKKDRNDKVRSKDFHYTHLMILSADPAAPTEPGRLLK